MTDDQDADRRFRLALGGLAVAALLLRVAYVWRTRALLPFGDAFYYHEQANLIADGRGFIEPYTWVREQRAVATAFHPPLWSATLSVFSFLGVRSWTGHRLVGCLLGAAGVVVIGLLAREVGGRRVAGTLCGGRRVGLVAAGIAVLYPYLWLNDVFALGESLAVLLAAGAALLAYRFADRPSPRRAVELGLVCGLAALTRAEQAAMFVFLAVPLILLVRTGQGTPSDPGPRERWARRARLLGVCTMAAALPVVPWVARNLTTFDRPEAVTTSLGVTLAVTNCDPTYDRGGIFYAYWNFDCQLGVEVPPGDESVRDAFWRRHALDYVKDHKGSLPLLIAARTARFYNLYRPQQQTLFDKTEARPRWASEVGLLGFYLLVALSIGGLVLLRRRMVMLLPLLVLPAVATLAVVLTYPITRYRAPAEVSFVVLASVMIDAGLARRRLQGGSPVGEGVQGRIFVRLHRHPPTPATGPGAAPQIRRQP